MMMITANLGPVHKYLEIFESATFSFCIEKIFRPHLIGFVADLLFSTLESGFKNTCIRRIRVHESRIWKEKDGDIKISGYVWTGS